MIQAKKVDLTLEELDSFIKILTERTGIVPRSSHRVGIKSFIEKKINEGEMSTQDYKKALLFDECLFSELVNESTVNETYFFREERQFSLLQNRIFPMWRMLNGKKEIKIWSAACSSGEEAYSLALLAKSCGINALITASDINSDVLSTCSEGIFPASSLRQMDGTSFMNLLKPYIRDDGKIEFHSDIRQCIKTVQINLSLLNSPLCASSLPRMQNIIFIRNVFIYFNLELRSQILHTIAEKCLADEGVMFVSMGEIGQLDSTIIPPSLEKVVDGNVFYFHKRTGGDVNG